MDLTKNCLRCSKYFECKDSAKSLIYTCQRFSVMKASGKQEAALMEDILELPLSVYDKDHHLPIAVPGSDARDSFDVFKTLKAVIKDNRIVSPDIKFPEGDYPEAPNFYTWCVSDKFLNQKPFVEQAIIGTRLFAEYCPDCTDMDWLLHSHKVGDGLIKFERKVALLEHGVCSHCHKTRLQFFQKKKLAAYVELALSAGQRSGKSALTAMLTTYITHRVLKLERPNEVYGLLKSTVLQGTFTALTFAQAKDTLWDPFYGNILESPWFQSYHEGLNQVGARHGEELYNLKDTFVSYKHRRVSVYPAGPDKRVLRGRTRIFGSIDELGWFPNDVASLKNVKMNATEVYIALERSLLTVRAASRNVIKRGFYNVPMGYFINISSPSSVRDKIMELVRKSQNSTKILGLCKPTWEMNPHVPKSVLAEEFKKDPVAAMRDYGAQPPLTNNAFISNKDSILQCMIGKKNALKMSYAKYKTSDGSVELYGDLEAVKMINRPCILSLDAGYSNNSFAFSLGFLSKENLPVVSVVGEIIPTLGMRINHSKMYSHLLSKLFEFCNIVKVVADRWNSLKILADMEVEHGAERQIYSLKYADMQMFKSYLDDGQVTLPSCSTPMEEVLKYDHSEYPACFKNKPVEHLLLQLLTVQDSGNGVLKGDGLTDDIARSVFLLFQQLIDPNNEELLQAPNKEMASPIDATQMAVYRNYSGGGSGANVGGGNTGAQNGSSLGMLRQRANT